MARKAATSDGPSADTRIAILYGSEEMRKREAIEALRATLEAVHGSLEILTYDGKSAALSDVLDELRTFSLMQTFKIVIVDDADQFVMNHREAMERYAAAPVDTATLVLRSIKWNKGNLDKLVAKVGFVEKCEPMQHGEVKDWILRRAKIHHQTKLELQAADLLIERMGTEIALIDGELGKLAVLAGEGNPITAKLVEQVVGRSSEEEAWSIQEAILNTISGGGAKPSIEMLHELVDLSGQPDVLVAYFTADIIRKLYLGMRLKQQGMNDFAIGRELRIWPQERQQVFTKALRAVSPSKLAELFDRIVELDVRAKSGQGDAVRNLEGFCALVGDK